MDLEYEFEDKDGYVEDYTYSIDYDTTIKYIKKFAADWLVKKYGKTIEEIKREREIVKSVIGSIYGENDNITAGLEELFEEEIKDVFERIARQEYEDEK